MRLASGLATGVLLVITMLACGEGGGGPITQIGPTSTLAPAPTVAAASPSPPPATVAATAAPTAVPTPPPLLLALTLSWLHSGGQSGVCWGLQGPLALVGASVTGQISGPGVVGQGQLTGILDPTGRARGSFTINQFGTYTTNFTATLGNQSARAMGQINVVAGPAATACA